MTHRKFIASVAAFAMLATPALADSKGYVVSWFTDANYFGGDSDCPEGLNLSAIDFYRRDLTRLGMPHDQIETLLREFPGEGSTQPWIPFVTTRGNGKDSVYLHPTTAPDPDLKTVKGKYAYGLNLDGRDGPNSFIDAETGERGIDNQYFRVIGCLRAFRGQAPPAHPSQSENGWDVMRHQMPAWVLTVSTDPATPNDVIVTLDRAVEAITLAANGAAPQPDMTYHLDPDPRSHNVLHGHVVNGRVVTDPSNVTMIADPFVMAVFKFTGARLRYEIKPDGSFNGVLGGYLPVGDIWYSFVNQGHIKEYSASIDMPGLYYALKKMADADADPVTGENRKISAAYRVEAVPAFVVPLSGSRKELKSAELSVK